MGFRFRKTFRLVPGIRITVSKSGVSASVGKPGASLNISDKGTRTTVGIPGTGMSYSQAVSSHPTAAPQESSSGNWLLWFIAALVVGMVAFGLMAI